MYAQRNIFFHELLKFSYVVLPCYVHRLRCFGYSLGMVMLHSRERPPPNPGEYSLISRAISNVVGPVVVLLVGTGWVFGHRDGGKSRFVSSVHHCFHAFTFRSL